ncbi:MAG: HAMP domain-containing histidine kinase, partial [Rhodothermales bacterium]|nr:HAMP domain-containing histidine kinase [Rhodothermales bacterium]
RIAALIDNAEAGPERREVISDIARYGDVRVTVVQPEGDVVDLRGEQPLHDSQLTDRPEMRFPVTSDEIRFAERSENGVQFFYAALRLPDSGLIVRVGQPRPPLFALITRMQLTLVVAMVMALLLAVLGSWIAAQRVTRPLQSIRNIARSISEGQFDEEIIVDSRASEFQDLAKSLNRMSDTFKEKIDELQRLARLQNEFIGNVSHEVRNPIFAVGGYLEALASSALSEEQRRFYAEKGLLNLERLNNLFNDLIEIARLEYREDLIKPEEFSLQELLDDLYELLETKAHEKGLQLIMDNPEVYVHADRNRIRQVLINLIENAIAYSEEGTVRCRYRRHLDKVRIEVVDTGRGIPEEHLEQIFERFHRVDPDRSRKGGGTGLGLSIVKQILHAHGENIHVESTLGRGTRFWFELPYAARETDVPDEA